MHRIGFLPDESSLELIRRLMNLRGIYLEGIFTHFARADETDKSSAEEQLKTFLDFRGKLEEMGITWLIAHASNSAAALEMPEANLDMVRFGVSLYGMAPSDECGADLPLTPVLELKSRVSFLKTLPAGCPISYGGTYVTDKPTRVATVPIGYGDGYPRALSNCGHVLVRGAMAPILGRICMDQLMIDVTDIPEVQEDDVVTLVGRDHAKEIRVEDLEKWGDVFRYEFTCCLNKRVPRIYLRSGSVIAMRNHFNE